MILYQSGGKPSDENIRPAPNERNYYPQTPMTDEPTNRLRDSWESGEMQEKARRLLEDQAVRNYYHSFKPGRMHPPSEMESRDLDLPSLQYAAQPTRENLGDYHRRQQGYERRGMRQHYPEGGGRFTPASDIRGEHPSFFMTGPSVKTPYGRL